MKKKFFERVYSISKEDVEKVEEYFFDKGISNYYFYETKEGVFLVLVSEKKNFEENFSYKLVEERETSSDEWIKNLISKPFEFIDGVYIDPDYHEINDKLVIRITPGLAFGTGLHTTTKLAATLLKKYLRQGMDVLDLGCGSGILSILAKKLGASGVLAVDNDKMAVESAIENVEKNNVEVEIRVSDLLKNVDGKYDLIVSNIIADVLVKALEDMPKFLKKNGIVILSGIIDSKLYLFEHLNIVEHRRKDEWNALVIKF
ncbi:ribosomal protein L11 methyltransferase [Thermosipho melanesiensis]|uniref:Ribosomal protein L11 methyltransferase n=2 Tax=Thermosipho melanesiensis TaxID=46541 RepID=PRMA_THEM4|nr:50S ribosomal protein L11 methyltransferase [Thermosipho melanesiensis]A6LJG3.1 RecName: Full=Ribosomal protein L11 methyltransferase; Short=L11 Mtase [Thermosipho melanesiensis BI429]ABR30064.1 ribosomal L11 methyltransferase [Thermosipho melanesiensis BI429]APT73261.1 ribosomal protein L11 methyltransferase [Thermosipho melanesiensis]OOC38657.1 ribosomal protein L11 methyltransferase [Thermosipho melanesiensis]OOC40461.1 ribosomal protein L11 methyltransferase [Thermosipho melanesiensis]